MQEDGWIKLARKMQGHWLWQDKPFSKGQAWVDLLFMANHQDKKIMFNGVCTSVKRGSKITSIRKLSEAWGWSKDKIRRFLDTLEADGMLTQKRDTNRTVLTIVNYGVYQSASVANGTATGHEQDVNGTETGTNKNVRTKERKNIPPISPTGDCARRFEIFWSAYPRKVTRARAEKAFVILEPDDELLSRMLAELEKQKQFPGWREEGGRYIPYPATWLKERRWEEPAAPEKSTPYAGYRRLRPDD